MDLAILLLIVFFSFIFIHHFYCELYPVREGMGPSKPCFDSNVMYENKGNIDTLKKEVEDLVKMVELAVPKLESGIKENTKKIGEIEEDAKSAVQDLNSNVENVQGEADNLDLE